MTTKDVLVRPGQSAESREDEVVDRFGAVERRENLWCHDGWIFPDEIRDNTHDKTIVPQKKTWIDPVDLEGVREVQPSQRIDHFVKVQPHQFAIITVRTTLTDHEQAIEVVLALGHGHHLVEQSPGETTRLVGEEIVEALTVLKGRNLPPHLPEEHGKERVLVVEVILAGPVPVLEGPIQLSDDPAELTLGVIVRVVEVVDRDELGDVAVRGLDGCDRGPVSPVAAEELEPLVKAHSLRAHLSLGSPHDVIVVTGFRDLPPVGKAEPVELRGELAVILLIQSGDNGVGTTDDGFEFGEGHGGFLLSRGWWSGTRY